MNVRTCFYCNKTFRERENIIANNWRTPDGDTKWSYAHYACVDAIILSRVYAIRDYIYSIGEKIPRRKS